MYLPGEPAQNFRLVVYDRLNRFECLPPAQIAAIRGGLSMATYASDRNCLDRFAKPSKIHLRKFDFV